MRDQGTSARAPANANDRQAPNTSVGERPFNGHSDCGNEPPQTG